MKYDKGNPYPCIENVNRRTKYIIQVKLIILLIFILLVINLEAMINYIITFNS